MLADDLLEDARHLRAKGEAEQRASCMRRAISTAYYALFHLLIEDFVKHWEFEDQRARLARMFSHQKMRDARFKPKNAKNPTLAENQLMEVITAVGQLQKDRHRALRSDDMFGKLRSWGRRVRRHVRFALRRRRNRSRCGVRQSLGNRSRSSLAARFQIAWITGGIVRNSHIGTLPDR